MGLFCQANIYLVSNTILKWLWQALGFYTLARPTSCSRLMAGEQVLTLGYFISGVCQHVINTQQILNSLTSCSTSAFSACPATSLFLSSSRRAFLLGRYLLPVSRGRWPGRAHTKPAQSKQPLRNRARGFGLVCIDSHAIKRTRDKSRRVRTRHWSVRRCGVTELFASLSPGVDL